MVDGHPRHPRGYWQVHFGMDRPDFPCRLLQVVRSLRIVKFISEPWWQCLGRNLGGNGGPVGNRIVKVVNICVCTVSPRPVLSWPITIIPPGVYQVYVVT